MSHTEVQGNLARYQYGHEDGHFQISVCHEKAFIPMLSLRNPAREAERLLANFELKKGYIAIVLGIAALPLVDILTEMQKKSGGFIIVYEADPVLARSLSVFMQKSELIKVITTENLHTLGPIIESLQVEHFLGYRIFKLGSSFKLAENDYRDLLASRISDLFTRLEFESTWIYNSLSQVALLSRARPARLLFHSMKGKHALVVSSGPSLRKSLPFIRKKSRSMFIACVDSAYRVLVRAGIHPHLVITLDSQPFTMRHFHGLPMGSPDSFPILYSDLVANPQVTMRWQGPLYFGVTAQYSDDFKTRVITPGCDFVEELVFADAPLDARFGDVQSGGSVATSLFDLLRQMSFKSITLVGQDLAYTWREIHTMGTHHADLWLSKSTNRLSSLEQINQAVLQKRHTRLEKSKTGSLIHSDYVLSLYRDWFSDAIAAVPFDVYDATLEGLPMPAAKPYHDLGLPPEVDFNGLLEKNSESYTRDINEKIEKFLSLIENSTEEQVLGQGFMRYIARKLLIQSLRTGESSPEVQERARAEKLDFVKKLKKAVAVWRGVYQGQVVNQ